MVEKKTNKTTWPKKAATSSYQKRQFRGPMKELLTEEQKASANIQQLSFDFACRITRLYKYLNEGVLQKADRDIIESYGKQLIRSASSIGANAREAMHAQSDADFLSKYSIAYKEADETNYWINLFHDNGYLNDEQFESLNNDIERILKILTAIVKKLRIKTGQQKEP